MRRFHFELEPVLRLREARERERLAEFAAVESERRALEARIRAQQDRITGGQDALRGTMEGVLDMGQLRGEAAATMGAMRQASRLAVELAAIYRRLEVARGALTEARRERRALELVREQRYEAWERDTRRREIAELDEIAAQRLAHPGRGTATAIPSDDPTTRGGAGGTGDPGALRPSQPTIPSDLAPSPERTLRS